MEYLRGRRNILFLLILTVLMFAACDGGGTETTSDPKAITNFSFTASANTALHADVTGTINEAAKTIKATVPLGTSVTGFIATFTTTGESVNVGGTTQTSGTTANDFTNPVTYTVTAADSTTADYTITVAVGIAGDKVTYTAGSVNFNMVYMPGGISFYTGTDDSGSATVTNAYLIGESEVTYELWSDVFIWAALNGYTFANTGTQGDGTGDTDQHPVTTINWRDAMVWTNALTEYYNAQNGTNLECAYYTDASYTTPIKTATDTASFDSTPGSEDNPYVKSDADGFRLLSSDEYELAARYIDDANSDGDILDANEYYPGNYVSGADAQYDATTGGSDFDGDGDTEYTTDVAVYSGNFGLSTAEVKSKSSNNLGLYDMSGNTQAWVFDLYGGGSNRLFRGGSWASPADRLQVGYLNYDMPYYEDIYLGFRFTRTQ